MRSRHPITILSVLTLLLLTFSGGDIRAQQPSAEPGSPPVIATEASEAQAERQVPDFDEYSDALFFAENAFAFGDFPRTIGALEDWLLPAPRQGISDETAIEGYTWMGVSAYFLDDERFAERAFVAGLRLSGRMQLDPLVFPPEVLQFFAEVRERWAERLDLDDRDDDNVVFIESRVEQHSLLVSMLPFGYGMFVNGQNEWGITYAILESSLLAVSAGLFWANFAERSASDDPENPLGYPDPERAELRRRIHIGTGAAFLGLVAINIVHGALIHQRDGIVQYRTLPEAPDDFEERIESRERAHRWNLRVQPILELTRRPHGGL